MAGKKVFTNAGELLADFLVSKKETDREDSDLNNALNIINSSSLSVLQEFDSIYKMSKEEILGFFDKQIRIELENLTISDGQKEIHILEMVQELYNALNYEKITNSSQFRAIADVYSTKLAEIIKNIASINRAYQIADRNINTSIANLIYKPLDYFLGGEADRSRVYYRFNGSRLTVANGDESAQAFKEVFRVTALANGADFVLGDEIIIGGADDTFTSITLNKPTTVNGDLTLVDGELQGTAVKARYGDLAELYLTDKTYSAGSLLMISSDPRIEATLNDNSRAFIGVVSDKPGFILNEQINQESTYSDNLPEYAQKDLCYCPIVLTGKTPVKTHTHDSRNGLIEKGDILFPSPSIKGCAIAIPFSERIQYEIDSLTKPIGVVLIGSYPKIQDDSNEIQLIYAKIN